MTDFPTHSHTSTSETPTLSYTRSLIRYPIRAEPTGIGDYREYPREHSVWTIQPDCHADVPDVPLLSETKMPTSGDKKPGDSLFLYTPLIVTDPPPTYLPIPQIMTWEFMKSYMKYIPLKFSFIIVMIEESLSVTEGDSTQFF